MSLFLFPRRTAAANAVRLKPPFQLLDEVRVPHAAGTRVVVATRESRPGVHLVCVRDDAGLQSWWAATVVRPAHFGLRIIDGGRS